MLSGVADGSRKNPLGPTGVVAAQRVQELRKKAGLTYKELADRLLANGRPIPALGLRRIEAEDRRIDADDLVALAVALGVNPTALLLPMTIEGTVELTGVTGEVDARRAWQWMDGQSPLKEADDDGAAEVEFQLRARPQGHRRKFRMGTATGRAALADELEAMGATVERDDDGGIRSVKRPEVE